MKTRLTLILLAAILTASAPAFAQDVITTVIGGGPNNIPALNANTNNPYQIAVDGSGNLYVADYGQSQVFKISAAGIITLVAGSGFAGYSGDGGPAVTAQLNLPLGLALDTASPANIYIGDTGNCLVRKITGSTGIITTIAGLVTTPSGSTPYTTCGYTGDNGKANAAEIYAVQGLALNPTTNDLYFADQHSGVVRKIAGGTPTGTITTVAGSQTLGSCGSSEPYGNGGAATSATLCYPNAVALDTSVSPANIFISESNVASACDIREVVGSSSKVYLVAGDYSLNCGYMDNASALSGELENPYQMHLSVSGATTTVQFADSGSQAIRQFTVTYSAAVPQPGALTTIAGGTGCTSGEAGNGGPANAACIYNVAGLAYDASGDYYLSAPGYNYIRKVTKSTGDISAIAGGQGNNYYSDPIGISDSPGTPSLQFPIGVYADPASSNVYVSGEHQSVYLWNSASNEISNFAGNGVYGFSGDGGPAASINTEFFTPEGIAEDSSGNIYIADYFNCVIREVSASGNITTAIAGTSSVQNACGYLNGPASSAQLDQPSGIAIDAENNIYISDSGNCAIRKFTASSGELTTIAGAPAASPTCGYSGDGGLAVNAEINAPAQLSLDSAGNLYFADESNNRIREIVAATTGIIQTVAGNGASTYSGDGPATQNSLDSPVGLTADPSGNLFITDSSNQLLRWVTPSGYLITFSGTLPGGTLPIAGFSGDGGPALDAQLFYPEFLSRDSSGNTYVADGNNQRIRKLTPFAGYGLSAAAITFDNQPVGTTSSSQPITVSAVGPTTISAISLTGTAFTETDDCTGQPLTANQTCEIDVYYKPTVGGKSQATLTLTSNAYFANNPSTIVLTGTAGSAAVAQVSPSSLTFTSTKVGSVSANQTITVTNTGTASLTISGVNVTGTNDSSFYVPSRTCGTTLAAGANCTLSIGFRPKASGTLTGSISITDNAGNSPQTIALTGTGVASPVVKFSVASLSFPSTDVGATSASQAVTLTNTGDATLTINYIISKGADPASFFDPSNTCGTSVAAGASCTINIAFRPKATGVLTGTIYVNDNAAGGEQGVNVSGTGIAEPLVNLSPTSLTFASTSVGTTSATQTVTLKNTGFAVLDISYFSTTGTNASSFAIPSKTCGSTLAINASCTFSVVFKPSATGAFIGDVAIHDNAVNSPQGLKLSGTGK